MSDEKDTLWITIRTDDHTPTGKELDRVKEAVGGVYGDEYKTLITTDDLEPIDADDARGMVNQLIEALENMGGR